MRAKAQATTPRRTELPALLALSSAALAAAAAEDAPEADDDEDDELDEPSEPPEEEEVGDGEPVALEDAPGLVELEPLLYGAEPEMPDAPPVAEGPVALPEAFEGTTGEVGDDPPSAEASVPVEPELVVVLTSVSPSSIDSYEPVRSP